MEQLDLNSAAEQIRGILNPATDEPSEAQEAPQESEVSDEADDSAAPDEVAANEAAPDEAEASDTREEVGADDEAESYELDADQFAQLLGVENDRILINDEGRPVFRAKVDGEYIDATPEQLLDAYQRDAYLTNRSKEVAETKKQQEAALQQVAAMYQGLSQYSDSIDKVIDQMVTAPYEDINWKELKNDYPEEYTAKKLEQREAKDYAKQVKEQLRKQLNESGQQLTDQMKQFQQQYLTEQRQILKQKVPNWSEGVAKDITDYMRSEGVSEPDIQAASDARIISWAYKAMLYDKGAKAAKGKKVKALPKVVKPGAKPSSNVVKVERLQKANEQFDKGGRTVEGAAALIKAMMQRSK